jgi:hypothetical protein
MKISNAEKSFLAASLEACFVLDFRYQPMPLRMFQMSPEILKIIPKAESVFVNVKEAQESIPRNRFRQTGNRFLGSLKGLQIRTLTCTSRRLFLHPQKNI